MGKFYEELQKATDEVSEVQPLYRSAIIYELSHSDYYEYEEKDKWGRPLKRPLLEDGSIVLVGNTDGKIKGKYLDTSLSYSEATYIEFFILLECKLNQSFRDDKTLAGVLLQIVCYLKQMQDSGDVLPKVIVVGSKVNCFTIGVNVLAKYVVRDIQGYKSASTTYKYNSGLMQELLKDSAIQEQLMIYDITPSFDMHDIVDRVAKIAKGTNLKLSLDIRSVAKAFDYFSMYVLKDSSKIDPRLQQKWFLQLILNADDNDFILDKDKAYIGGEKVNIDGRAFRSFQTSYKVTEPYTSEEERQITATADRLIEDCDRRRKGDFYTPTVWVDEAHKMLTKELGADWKEKYVVWDCAAGTKNLTRDYGFKELYSSTLIEGDLALSSKYNVSGTPRNELGCAFQYDFLNDDVDEFEEIARKCKIEKRKPCLDDFKETKLYQKAPKLLESLCAGKKLLFFINPPYGTAKNGGCDRISKAGIAKTSINNIMLDVDVGQCKKQLYIQFLYRIYLFYKLFNNSILIGQFTPTALYTSQDNVKLLAKMREDMLVCVDGFMLCASEFADVSDRWGICFSLIKGKTPCESENTDFIVYDRESLLLKQLNRHTLRAISKDKALGNWAFKVDKNKYTIVAKSDGLYITSALKPCGAISKSNNYVLEMLGSSIFNANNIEHNTQLVSLGSAMFTPASAKVVVPENFKRVCVAFAARRLITGQYATWINCKDEYMIPDTTHKDYPRFEADSIVYALFNTASNQSSLRQIDYNGKKWNIKNEFFWLSRNEMLELARAGEMNKEVEQDIELFGEKERYVYEQLQKEEIKANLSDKAKEVLAKATELLKESFKYRKDFAYNHPEYHINTWDAGWYQIKGILKEYMPDELKAFSGLYGEFADELRPLVYELGFLYK